jgi:tetratricopeptide (TPR) repeat protein
VNAAGLLIVALLAAAAGLQAVHERGGGPPQARTPNLLYVRSPEAMKRLALSFDQLLADVYWIRTVQHYGSTKLSNAPDKQYDLLYPLLDLTTSLDPRMNVAYYFGAIYLAEPFPGGPGRPDLAIALLQKGLAVQPERWQFAQAIGFVYYWWLMDYTEAAAWFTRAAEMPEAPIWLPPLAAVTLAQGGQRGSSRVLWEQFARTAEDEWFRNEARRRLRQLDAMDQIDALNEALRRDGQLRGLPRDPTGVPYRVRNGVVTLDPSSPLNPLPTEAPRLP